MLANTRIRLLNKLATLPLGTVLEKSSGSYKNIIVERVDSVETTLAHIVPEMTSNIVGALAVLVLLFTVDWRMGLAMLIVLPLYSWERSWARWPVFFPKKTCNALIPYRRCPKITPLS